MKYYGPIGPIWSMQPERYRKRMAANKIAHGRLHRMVTGELNGLAGSTVDRVFNKRVFGGRCGGVIRIQEARKRAVSRSLIKGIARDLAGKSARCYARKRRRHFGIACNPFGHLIAGQGLGMGQLRRCLNRCLFGLRQCRNGLRIEQLERGCRRGGREKRVETCLVDVIEEREELIKLALRERVKFMVVAAAAFERQPQKRSAECRDPVVHGIHSILLLDRAALTLLAMQSIKSGGQNLFVSSVRQKIAGDLPRCEIVPWQVAVESRNHPISPRPHWTLVIHLKSVAI